MDRAYNQMPLDKPSQLLTVKKLLLQNITALGGYLTVSQFAQLLSHYSGVGQ